MIDILLVLYVSLIFYWFYKYHRYFIGFMRIIDILLVYKYHCYFIRFTRIIDIQALRAFRRAEIVFEAVLFESCVGEAAGSLAVASIFFFEGWYLRVSF